MKKTREKIEELKYRLEQMRLKLKEKSLKEFDFELRAFVESGRNVTFCLQKEIKGKEKLECWYKEKQNFMKKNKTFIFFKELRNKITKEGTPGHTKQSFYYEFKAENVPPKDSFRFPVRFNYIEGEEIKIKTENNNEASVKVLKAMKTPIFPELNSKHVIEACEDYYAVLENLINEAESLINNASNF